MELTIVIPTVGRATLAGAVGSLLAQTDPGWRAVVGGDGLIPEAVHADPRIEYLELPAVGHPGRMRNLIIDGHCTSEWIGFLDDDDRLADHYVAAWRDRAPECDAVLFRMEWKGVVLPRGDALRRGNVGISFAIRRSLWDEFRFVEEGRLSEQQLLVAVAEAGRRVVVTDEVGYFVRPEV